MIRSVKGSTRGALLAAIVCATAAVAHADHEPEGGFVLPPPPLTRPPILVGEVHVSAVIPVQREALCPDGAACIFGGGAGIGGSIERRWTDGFGIALGYDAWFLDSSAVYELGLMQSLRAAILYAILPNARVHPFASAGIGALVFGDTLRIASFGAAADAAAGAEIELTVNISLRLGLGFRLFTTSSFVTASDRVPRGEGAGLSSALTLNAGIVLLESP